MAAYWTLIYGTFVNWFVTLLSAYFGTSKMTPISGHGFVGTDLQENVVRVGYTTFIACNNIGHYCIKNALIFVINLFN